MKNNPNPNKSTKAIREAEVAVGTSSYELSPKQVAGKDFSRSLYVAESIKKGDIITEASIEVLVQALVYIPSTYQKF